MLYQYREWIIIFLMVLKKQKLKKVIAQDCLLMIKIIQTITNQDKIFSQEHIILN